MTDECPQAAYARNATSPAIRPEKGRSRSTHARRTIPSRPSPSSSSTQALRLCRGSNAARRRDRFRPSIVRRFVWGRTATSTQPAGRSEGNAGRSSLAWIAVVSSERRPRKSATSFPRRAAPSRLHQRVGRVVVGSTSVPIAVCLALPIIRSPSRWPGTARSSASWGRWRC